MSAPFRIDLGSTDRCCFFGRTGSGKTTLALRILMSSAMPWLVLDPKEGITRRDVPGVRLVRAYNKGLPRQVIQLPTNVEIDAWWWWDDIIRAAWKDRRRLIYVDELTLTNPSETKLAPPLARAIRTGRSRGVPVWIGSQRPSGIPSTVFTEAEHFFVFSLNFARDREKVISFTHDKLEHMLSELSGHDFVYYNVRTTEARIVRQPVTKR